MQVDGQGAVGALSKAAASGLSALSMLFIAVIGLLVLAGYYFLFYRHHPDQRHSAAQLPSARAVSRAIFSFRRIFPPVFFRYGPRGNAV